MNRDNKSRCLTGKAEFSWWNWWRMLSNAAAEQQATNRTRSGMIPTVVGTERCATRGASDPIER